MTTRRTALCLSVAAFAYMAAFAALYLDKLAPIFQQITKALGQ